MQAIINWFAETNVQAAIIGPFLSAILTAITYCFSQNTQKKITISNLIQDIERLSTEHWCSPASDEINRARCIEILHKFKTLGWKMDQKKDLLTN